MSTRIIQDDPNLLPVFLFIVYGNPDNNLESVCITRSSGDPVMNAWKFMSKHTVCFGWLVFRRNGKFTF
jgi:hypothetical protein